ncbi:recombinase family protein [Janibacter melonis]|uniref:recombinase family protein n=1 Tax=Janibacter melonis TaxID=262209 RepID=UPI002043B244|nr:recombinase family protein [Janibacter melonis]MCM3555686.1 recombinase family protein [Janibacter melonis]
MSPGPARREPTSTAPVRAPDRVDLRLLVPALVAWAVTVGALGVPVPVRVGCALACLLLGGVVLASRSPAYRPIAHRPTARHDDAGHQAMRRQAVRGSSGTRPASWRSGLAALLGLSCLTSAACLLASAAHDTRSRVGGVVELAEQRVSVTGTAVVLGEPVLVRGHGSEEPAVMLRVRPTQTSVRGQVRRLHAPVVVRSSDPAWRDLRWHDEIRVAGTLAPGRPYEPTVAVLRPRGPPEVGERGPLLAAADHMRSRLREATDHLPADARGLVPALVIGDTSVTPPDLTDDMLVTGMSHLSAVSGSNVSYTGVILARMRALIYARVSLDPRGQGRSVGEQEHECRAWADREGWDVVDVITETGSASSFARGARARTRWDELTARLSGDVDVLLTWEASRATRQLAEYVELRELCARHGVRWGYSGTLYDLASRGDRFRTGLDALLGEDESARTSERALRSVRARAHAGQPHGKLPYGYRREYDPTSGALLRQVPDEEQAPVVREIVRRVIGGDGVRTIASDLSDRGVPRPRAPRSRATNVDDWLGTTVRRIALSPTYAALRTHRGEVVGDATWEPLVSRDEHEKAVAILTDGARQTRSGDSTARHLLSGIALCGECSTPLRVLTNRGKYRSYACMQRGCMKVSRTAGPLEDLTERTLLAILANATPGGDSAGAPELDQARADLVGLEGRLAGFTDSAADGDLSPASLARIEARLLPQIRQARARVRDLSRPAGVDAAVFDDPHAWWEDATLENRRALVRATLRVVVNKAPKTRTFAQEYVDVTPVW